MCGIVVDEISWLLGNAEQLPVGDESCDVYTVAFGIRNMTHIDKVSVSVSLLFCLCVSFSVSVGLVVLVVQWFGVGLVIERSLIRLPVGALSSQLGQLSL